MADAMHQEHVSIGHILQVFGTRGFAFLLLMLSLLNIVIFMVPLISLLFGIPMIILAAQLVIGLPAPVFPLVVQQRTIPRDALVQGLERAMAITNKTERYIRPRLRFLSLPAIDRVHGLFALVMAIMVAIPIPLFNVPPSVALALLAVGMLEKDGVFIILAYGVGAWCLVLFESLDRVAHSLNHIVHAL
jgi:hypothetical protein